MDQITFSLFFQSLINGLNQGAIYVLIALGYTMVYGIIRMINFAHGDFIMIGAYTLFYTIPLMVNAGMPAWLSVIVAIAVCALVGVLVETFAYRHCAGLADGSAGYRTGRRRQHRNPAGRFRLRPRRRPQSPRLRAKNLRRPPCRRDSSCSILIVGRKQDGE